MGEHAALTALEWEIGREEQDELAARQPPATSPRRTTAASSTTWSRRSSGSSATRTCAPTRRSEKLAKLKPVFGGSDGDATMTAGNSTPLTDGASAVLLSHRRSGPRERGLPVLAYLVDYETAAVDYVHGDEGLLMAPAYAVPRMLARDGPDAAGLRLLRDPRGVRLAGAGDAEGVGVREFCKERLGLDAPLGSIDRSQAQRQRLLAGGRATRSPPPAAGSSTAGQAARREGPRPGAGRGLISICAAGGQGVTAILEA